MNESRRPQDVQDGNQTTSSDVETKTAAERRRRLAALGTSNESDQEGSENGDSDDQNEQQIFPPKTRAVRFTQSPLRDSVSLPSVEVFLGYPPLTNASLDEQPAEI